MRQPHGTANGYFNGGCRCDACHAAQREYSAKYRAANLERVRERERLASQRYYAKHGNDEARREYQREYQRRYYASDEGFHKRLNYYLSVGYLKRVNRSVDRAIAAVAAQTT